MPEMVLEVFAGLSWVHRLQEVLLINRLILHKYLPALFVYQGYQHSANAINSSLSRP